MEDNEPQTEPDPRKVFVVYGRDGEARDELFNVLRALDLRPLEWTELVAGTGSAAPYIGDVLEDGFRAARAAVVLFTPDDEARLSPDLQGDHEEHYETELTGQPRPNVLIEAGMALGVAPTRTLILELGTIRPATDLDGRHVIRLGTKGSLLDLADRLEQAGCPVRRSSELANDDRFARLAARRRPTRPPGPASVQFDRDRPEMMAPDPGEMLVVFDAGPRIERDEFRLERVSGADGEFNVLADGSGSINRLNVDGELWVSLEEYRGADGQLYDSIQPSRAAAGQRKLYVYCQVKASKGQHTFLLVVKEPSSQPGEHLAPDERIRVTDNQWATISHTFSIPPGSQCRLRLVDRSVDVSDASLQFRRLRLSLRDE